MTNEYLSKANELHEKIKETTKMIADLQNSYMNSIKAVNYRDNVTDDSSYVTFSKGDELHTMILNYFRNQLSVLQQEFERL